MNKRIRELAEQAGAEIHGHPDYSTICVNGQDADALMKKFAELIIQECGKVAYEETGHFPKPCDWLLDKFKRHFGVKE